MKEEYVDNILGPEPTEAVLPAPTQESGQWMTTSSNPAWVQIQAARARATRYHKHVLCGIAGPPKSGKSGQVLDSLTEEEKAAGAEIHHIDFDAGGESTKAAHHSGSKNIVVLNPWVSVRPNAIAISPVIGQRLANPRTPSVPKNCLVTASPSRSL